MAKPLELDGVSFRLLVVFLVRDGSQLDGMSIQGGFGYRNTDQVLFGRSAVPVLDIWGRDNDIALPDGPFGAAFLLIEALAIENQQGLIRWMIVPEVAASRREPEMGDHRVAGAFQEREVDFACVIVGGGDRFGRED